MKHNLLLFLAGILPLLVSCASQPVPLASVGPNPLAGYSSTGETGSLVVFSDREPSSEGDNPPFYQPTDYEIYNTAGKRVSYVDKRDRTTLVYLDDAWTPPPGTPKAELVSAPNGRPVGWSADLLPRR